MINAWEKVVFQWYETLVFESVRNALASEYADILRMQLTSLTHVIRLADGRESDFYRATGLLIKKPDWRGIKPFPWGDRERIVGKVVLRDDEIMRTATVWAANAYIFSIEFDENPSDLSEANTTIESVEVI